MTSYHNPAAVPDSQIGPNHKLLSTDDLDKPLPEGAEYWVKNGFGDEKSYWEKSDRTNGKNLPCKSATYRIPLSLSDRLRSERNRLDELITIAEEVQKGREFQVHHEKWEKDEWASPGDPNLEPYLPGGMYKNYSIRLKPAEPTLQSIPWTLETHPDSACVMPKNQPRSHHSISHWMEDKCFVEGFDWVTYAELHSDWLQRNGDPAGQKVTV